MEHDDESNFTTAPIEPGPVTLPEWFDMRGAMRFAPLGRTLLYECIRNGTIRSITLRRKGQVKGKRLISVKSLKAFLDGQPAGIERDVSRQMKRVRKAAG